METPLSHKGPLKRRKEQVSEDTSKTRNLRTPRMVKEEITLHLNRWLVAANTRVSPFLPQVVPAWWAGLAPISSP